MLTDAANSTRRIGPLQLDEARRRGDRVVVVDVRHRDAWSSDPTRVPGAVWLPLGDVPQRSRDLPAAAHLVVYCS
jgi:rhodanese-related sulfurtransferase